MEGVKTGYTRASMYGFVGAAKRGGIELFSVVLGANTLSARFSETRKLLDWGYLHCHLKPVVYQSTVFRVAPAGTPTGRVVIAQPKQTAYAPLLDGGAWPTRKTSLSAVNFPLKAGTQVGVVYELLGSIVVAKVPLIATKDVPATPLTRAATAAQ